MKIKFLLTALLAVVFFTSCTKNEDTPIVVNDAPPTKFMPLAHNNYWVYDVKSQGNTTRDSLYTQSDIVFNSVPYKKMETLSTPTGFFSSTLKNNGVKIDDSKLVMTGNFTFDFGVTSPISIAVNDFTFFNESANPNDILSTISGTENQTIEGYPLTIDYTLKAVCDGDQPSLPTIDGNLYTNIKKTKVILTLKITMSQTISGIPFTVMVMPSQDVMISTQYYCKGIGMVYSKTDINYQLSSIPGITLPVPSSGNSTQEEFLSTYLLN